MTGDDQGLEQRIATQATLLKRDQGRNRARYEQILLHLSALTRTVTDPDKRLAMELLATVVTADYELKVLLLKELTEPDDREVWEKYLALRIWAILEELPRQIGQVHRDAAKSFNKALKPVREDTAFVQELAAIRNKIVAHQQVKGGDHWLAQWHLTAIERKVGGVSVLRSTLVAHATTVLEGTKALGRALLLKYPDLLPPPGARSQD